MPNVLTVAFATYKDFEGVWSTVTDLQKERRRDAVWVDLLCVDNSPGGCQETRKKVVAAGGRYLHRPDLVGTAAPRDFAVRVARTPWVMVVDSHIAFDSGALGAAVRYARDNPASRDLVQGPMVYDDEGTCPTHWKYRNPPALYGEWAVDPRACAGDPVGRKTAPPFEIPAQGLGLFMVRREAWPGFNPLARGFGGEEGYIHEKIRRLGGRCLCLPMLRWYHRFRVGTQPPYTLRLEDEVWNLLVEHRELGIEAEEQIFKDYGSRIPPASWDRLRQAAHQSQAPGKLWSVPRELRVLGLWYTNNAAPAALTKLSLESIRHAALASRHQVRVVTCSWQPVEANPFRNVLYKPPTDATPHQNILNQQILAFREGHSLFGQSAPDVVCFLEHDVRYSPGHFDRIADEFAHNPDLRVVANRSYLGVNETGYLKLVRDDKPLHQLGVSTRVLLENFERCQADIVANKGWCHLEPDHTNPHRTGWGETAPSVAPALHVNHRGRLTSHGDECYEKVSSLGPKSRTLVVHPVWGDYRVTWPYPVDQPAGCTTCASPSPHASVEDWLHELKSKDSDFGAAHLETLRFWASKCETVGERTVWRAKPGPLVALLASTAKKVYSSCPLPKVEYEEGKRLAPARLEVVETMPEVDLLMIDPVHDGDPLYKEVLAHAGRVRKYLVFHATHTFGEKGENTGFGVLPAVRAFVRRNPEWGVVHATEENHGLLVLSRAEEDRKDLPNVGRQMLNYGGALMKRWREGRPATPEAEFNRRMEICLLCEHRVVDTCSACGCPLAKKLTWATEECGLVRLGKPPKWGAVAASEPHDAAAR